MYLPWQLLGDSFQIYDDIGGNVRHGRHIGLEGSYIGVVAQFCHGRVFEVLFEDREE